MTDPPPGERMLDALWQYPELDDYSIVLVTIPTLYGAGAAIWLLAAVKLYVVLGGASLFACGVLFDALFLNPP